MSVPLWTAKRRVTASLPLPTSVADLLIWWDASDLSSLSTSLSAMVAPTTTGQAVLQWKNKALTNQYGYTIIRNNFGSGTPAFQYSADGRHAVQFHNRAQNNGDWMRSNNAFRILTVANLPAGTAQGWTCFHVLKRTATPVSNGFCLNTQPSGSGAGPYHRFLEVNTSYTVVTSVNSAGGLTSTNFTTSPNSQRAVLNGGIDYVETSQNMSTNTLSCYVGIGTTTPKTVAVTQAGATGWNGSINIGGRYNASGCDHYAILIYGRTLTDAERATVRAYLTAQWGL